LKKERRLRIPKHQPAEFSLLAELLVQLNQKLGRIKNVEVSERDLLPVS